MERRRVPRDSCASGRRDPPSLLPGIPPPQPTSAPVPDPAPLSHPLQEARSRPAGVPPPPSLAPHRPVVRRRRAGGGAGVWGWGSRAHPQGGREPTLPEGPRACGPQWKSMSGVGAGVCVWKRGRGGRRGGPWEGAPRAEKEAKAGGCEGPSQRRDAGRRDRCAGRAGRTGPAVGCGARRARRASGLEARAGRGPRREGRGRTARSRGGEGRAPSGGGVGALAHLHAWRGGAIGCGRSAAPAWGSRNAWGTAWSGVLWATGAGEGGASARARGAGGGGGVGDARLGSAGLYGAGSWERAVPGLSSSPARLTSRCRASVAPGHVPDGGWEGSRG